jgi:TRAP-type C4-dicarboxylate transport system permease small subunit
LANNIAQHYISAIRKTGKVCHDAAMVILFLLMALGASEVIGRFGFNRPIVAVLELSQIMQAMMVFLAWAYTTAERSHVRVEIFARTFPPRLQAILEFVIAIVVIVLFALIAWKATEKAVFYWETNMQVDVLFIPLAPFQLFLAIGAVLLCLELIARMIELIPQMKGGS